MTTVTNGLGTYQFSSVDPGGTYVVTLSKNALSPGTAGVSTVDVVAVQRQFLGLGTPLSECRLTAADVNDDTAINTVDVIAVQRFFLGLQTGIANVGKYQFNPTSRNYPEVVTDQTDQNYQALVIGDVVAGFVHRPDGSPHSLLGNELNTGEIPPTVAALSLPNAVVDASVKTFVSAVKTSTIDPNNKLIGFQGDFSFDERAVGFQNEPVQKAGLTGGDWNVSGNVLPGIGPIRTLRISAFSNDFVPLAGEGTLFELRMKKVGEATQAIQLLWTAPPNFIFIDTELNTQKPGYTGSGSVILNSGW
jgi:hypothetical protein